MQASKGDAGPIRDPGSFRDSSGYVFASGAQLLRSINPSAVAAFTQVRDSGVLDDLIGRGLLIGYESLPVDAGLLGEFAGARGERPALLLRHPKIPFIAYPYEWTFGQLKDAALVHLDIQLAALDRGVVLSDATPYNIQFVRGQPIHIDLLSFRPYRDGELWAAYHQFCRLFLLPLLLEAWTGLAFQPWLRARLEGIELGDAVRLLPWHKRWLNLHGLLHVSLHHRSERAWSSASDSGGSRPLRRSLPKSRYRALLSELRALIAGLQSRRVIPTFWKHYDRCNSYTEEMQVVRKRWVADFVRAGGIASIWDIGGNSGDFSIAALEAGARHAVVLDSDLDALERAYRRSRDGYSGLQPVLMDCADPSASRGWLQVERKGLLERRHADAVLALAVIHHLAIGRNIPLASIVLWLVSLAPSGIVEFVPKTDPMVMQMLLDRDDVFADYTEQEFRRLLSEMAHIDAEHRFAENQRLIVTWRRR